LPKIDCQRERDAFIAEFLSFATSDLSNICFARDVIKLLMDQFGPEFLLIQIYNPDFLRSPNFAAVFVIVRYFEAVLKRLERSDFLEFCATCRGPKGVSFDSEEKKRIFENVSDPRSVAALLHTLDVN
jgi:hypothetical protein